MSGVACVVALGRMRDGDKAVLAPDLTGYGKATGLFLVWESQRPILFTVRPNTSNLRRSLCASSIRPNVSCVPAYSSALVTSATKCKKIEVGEAPLKV